MVPRPGTARRVPLEGHKPPYRNPRPALIYQELIHQALTYQGLTSQGLGSTCQRLT